MDQRGVKMARRLNCLIGCDECRKMKWRKWMEVWIGSCREDPGFEMKNTQMVPPMSIQRLLSLSLLDWLSLLQSPWWIDCQSTTRILNWKPWIEERRVDPEEQSKVGGGLKSQEENEKKSTRSPSLKKVIELLSYHSNRFISLKEKGSGM